MSSFDLHIGTCGCCEPASTGTPELVFNRPALDEVLYRVGRYPTFRQAMLNLIPELGGTLSLDEGVSGVPLSRWTSRQSDDYGIAIIEMWSVIGDILTFYQERYANEAWLRTAEGRDAVRRLAGLLGYRLAPGAAAETYLAYLLEEEVQLDFRQGLRVQSVPKDGETPQKYETESALEATAGLNRFRLYRLQEGIDPLARSRTRATLTSESDVPTIGDVLGFFTPGGSVEERAVTDVTEIDGRSVVEWSRPLGTDHSRVFVLGTSWRLFGATAPPSYLTATPIETSSPSEPSNFLDWSMEMNNDYGQDTSFVRLDGQVNAIEPGSSILVDDAGVARVRKLTAVASVMAEIGPLAGPATELRFNGSINHDVRTTVVHELKEELRFQTWEIRTSDIPAGQSTFFAAYPETTAVEEGRLLIIDDASQSPMLVEVKEDATKHNPGAGQEFLRIELNTPTQRGLDADTAFAYGNVLKATHGETVEGEILGNGDASTSLQRFTVKKSPVTYTTDPSGDGGVRSSLRLYIDRVEWTETSGLFGTSPKDRVFTTELDDEQRMIVRLGDGITGSLAASGRANVVATYRQSLGREGNVDAGQVQTALDKPTGLNEVINPLPATGGVDAETVDAARGNAPNTVRTFDRAISIADFGHMAEEFVGVSKALADWAWDGEERVVFVTVGGDHGEALGSKLGDVQTYIDLRRDPNRSVRIGEYREVPFVVHVEIHVQKEHNNEDVATAARSAIEGYFAYGNRDFGQAVHLSDLYAVVHGVGPVASARVTRLRYKRHVDRVAHGVSAVVAVHAPIFGARHAVGSLLPAELATLAGPADLVITATGGLEE